MEQNVIPLISIWDVQEFTKLANGHFSWRTRILSLDVLCFRDSDVFNEQKHIIVIRHHQAIYASIYFSWLVLIK